MKSISFSMIATLIAASALSATVAAQDSRPRESLLLTLRSTVNHADEVRYEFQALSGRLTQNNLLAPDGTLFGKQDPAEPGSFVPSLTSVPDLSFQEVVDRFVGGWVFQYQGDFGIEEYEFDVLPFEMGDTLSTPTIISPPEGAVVPRSFEVNWEWPGRSKESIRVGVGSANVVQVGPLTALAEYQFDPGQTRADARMSLSASMSLNQFITDATAVGRDSLRVEPDLSFSMESARRSFTVVAAPEPASFFSLTVACLLWGGFTGRSCR